jgi:hypothetical protein
MNLDFHVITPAGSVYICSLVDRKCSFILQPVQVPPLAPAAAPAQPAPGR